MDITFCEANHTSLVSMIFVFVWCYTCTCYLQIMVYYSTFNLQWPWHLLNLPSLRLLVSKKFRELFMGWISWEILICEKEVSTFENGVGYNRKFPKVFNISHDIDVPLKIDSVEWVLSGAEWATVLRFFGGFEWTLVDSVCDILLFRNGSVIHRNWVELRYHSCSFLWSWHAALRIMGISDFDASFTLGIWGGKFSAVLQIDKGFSSIFGRRIGLWFGAFVVVEIWDCFRAVPLI